MPRRCILLYSRKKQFQDGGIVPLAITDRQIDLRCETAKGASGHCTWKKGFSVRGQERTAAGRNNEGHDPTQVVHFMTWFDVYAALFQIPVDGQSQSWRPSRSAHSGPGNTEKSFTRDFLQGDGVFLGEEMILRQIDLERFFAKKEILQPGTSILLAKKGDVDQPLGKC